MTSLQAVLVVCRFAHFASCMFVFGASAFLLALSDMPAQQASARSLHAMLNLSAVLATASALLWLACVLAAMSGGWHGIADLNTVKTVSLGTEFGQVWTWRIVVSLLVAIAALWNLPQRRFALPVLAGVLLATIALTGHAAMETGDRGGLHRAADAVHLLSGGYWLGGLALLPFLLHGSNTETACRILHRFSGYGVVAVVLVLVSGIGNALFIVHDWAHVLRSTYGMVLLTKIALVGVMVSIASLNRWLLMPNLRQTASAPSNMRTSIAVEILVGGLVLAAASLLGTVSPPSTI